MIGLIKAVRNFDSGMGRSFAGFAETCVLRQMYTAIEASNRKKHMPLNSYISLYEESETNKNGTKLPLIDLIEPDGKMILRHCILAESTQKLLLND